MPNPIFFNLPDAKRQRLTDAMWAEFTTVSYMDVSINRIIQEAGISRGSFYQYFSGKQDAFVYLLSTIVDTVKNMFRAQLTAHSNDLFDAVLGMYDMVIWRKKKSRRSKEMERLETILQLNIKLDMSQFTEFFQHAETDLAIMDLLHRSGYVIRSTVEARALLHMLCSITLSTITIHLRSSSREESVSRQMMEYQLKLIRSGLEAQRSTL